MTHSRPRFFGIALALVLGAAASCVRAEDIDLFIGSAPATAVNRPNILFVIDNSANWAAASQHWPGGIKQGQSELNALRNVLSQVTDNVNIGLMMFTAGAGSNKNGAYVRYAVRQMTAVNKAALQELIGDATCVNGSNSLNGTPNCIYNNFSGGSLNESINTAATDYSAALFEVFKYLGGYTSPANAQSGIAGSPVDASHFGPLRYAGNPDSRTDPAAFSTPWTTYNPPLSAANNCAKTYVIFIGNGFPTQDSPATLLSGVGGDTTQLAMQQFVTTSAVQSAIVGNTGGICVAQNSCSVPQSVINANPGYDTYQCVNPTSAGCTGNNRNFDYQASKTVITVTPTGTSATPTSSTARFADEWAKFLYTTDVNGAAGQQNAAIYTIDVFRDQQDQNETALLFNMAKFGGGRYFQATSESAILNAMKEILVEIQSVNSVFSSASLPISTTNRSQNANQVYIGMFRPDASAQPRWYGNLKRYQIGLFSGAANLADANGVQAVSATTGFLQPCTASFWTTDSGTYWNFSSSSSGLCTTLGTNAFSDLPDGPTVEKGAAAEVIRKGNNPAAATPTYAVNRTVYTCNSATGCPSLTAFNTANVSQSALGAATTAEQQNIVNFTLGYDVNDENANGNVTETRPSLHGDVAHSRPLPVNYGGSTGVVIYYGANDGTLRAISGNDGHELWAFVAPEHYGKLKRLLNNTPVVQYPGMPAGITPTPLRKDYFFDGSAGLYQNADNSQVWIFPSMRRGGRMLYAFDVTTPSAPTPKWRQGCPNPGDDTGCTTGFSGIGQTWSTPNVAKIKSYNSGNNPVVIVGGGYDACEDADTSTPTCDTTTVKGNKVYIIDANTGALVATFNTDRSVAADVTLVDRDFDGLVDHAYAADTGGNLYRIDFVSPTTLAPLAAPSNWTITKIAYTTGGGRKFLFGAGALATAKKVFLGLGAGDREHPLQLNYPYSTPVQNFFYMFIDTFNTTAAVNLDGTSLTEFNSVLQVSNCSTTLSNDALGWRLKLDAGRGEQTVTSATIFGGLVFFSTNRPIPPTPGTCNANLGEARGYAVNLLNASGAVGTQALCGGALSGVFVGGGLPPSPVAGTVSIGGQPVSVLLGGIDRSGGTSSVIGSQKIKPAIAQKRARIYWYTRGDK